MTRNFASRLHVDEDLLAMLLQTGRTWWRWPVPMIAHFGQLGQENTAAQGPPLKLSAAYRSRRFD
jgi:hypothetical protein